MILAPKKKVLRFTVGAVVEFFPWDNHNPRLTGKVLWVRGVEPKSFEQIREELRPFGATRLTYQFSARRNRSYLVEMFGPRGDRQIFAPRDGHLRSILPSLR